MEVENADLELLTTLMNKGLIRGEDVDAETLQETADEQPAVEIAKYYYVARKLYYACIKMVDGSSIRLKKNRPCR